MKILKYFVLLLIFTAFASSSNAQVKIALGLQAGVNFGSASQTIQGIDQNLSSKAGMIAGGFVDIGLSKQISIVPGLRYIQKGSKENNKQFPGVAGAFDVNTTVGMLEFPALLRVKFPLTEVNPY
ncbi:MAG: outer membrane beta-barrel protein, partial [Ignavibacteria bacterium]